MRKWNALLSLAALVLLAVHGVLGSFQLLGAEIVPPKALPRLVLSLLILHGAIGLKYTIDSLRVWKKTGAGYFQENRLFWARRISGFAILFFLLFHVGSFGTVIGGVFQLQRFTHGKLILHLLLAASLAVHLLTDLRPLMISLGIRGGRKWLGDLLFVLSVLLLFIAGAFVIYYLRWNVW